MFFDFSKSSILVIGDIMLDQYYFGRVSRIFAGGSDSYSPGY